MPDRCGRPPFRPSTHGCGFGNAQTVRLPIRLGPLRVGQVVGGLCGGMVLDALRTWQLGAPPAGRSTADLSRVFGAQLRSFQLPTAPCRYLRLQRPRAGRARRRANVQAREAITHHLSQDQPVPVALICRLSTNPLAVTSHHVVLAYDIVSNGSEATTSAVYDPNHPGDDNVRLCVDAEHVRHSHRRGVHAAFVLHAR